MADIKSYPTSGAIQTPLLLDMSHWDFRTLSDQWDLTVSQLTSNLVKMSSSYDPYAYVSLPAGPYWMELSFSGRGFGTPDAEGFPTTGHVNTVVMFDNVSKLQLAVSGLDLAPGPLLSAYREGRTGDLVAMFTSGNDRIQGGYYNLSDWLGAQTGDAISGGAGDDTILGHGGHDTLGGGDGDDLFSTVDHTTASAILGDRAQVDGGSGVNTVTYADAPFAVTVDLGDPTHGQDMLVNIQRVIGSAFGDLLSGSAGDDTLTTGGGPDTVKGGAGDDLISTVGRTAASAALAGHAQVDGGAGVNTVTYADAPFAVTVDLSDPTHSQDTLINIQRVIGSAFGDLLGGSAGDDTLTTGGGPDTVRGGAGDDVLIATGVSVTSRDSAAPHNMLFGGDGDDRIRGDTGFNQVNGNAGDDTIIGTSQTGDWLLGGQGSDVIDASIASGHNILNGNLGNDTITGALNGDTLRGGQGDDVITGGGYDGSPGDLIFGDLGHNTISGSGGGDTFVAGAGHDVVTDFKLSEQDQVLVGSGVTWQAAQSGADVLVTLSNGGDMLLRNVQLDSLATGWIVTS